MPAAALSVALTSGTVGAVVVGQPDHKGNGDSYATARTSLHPEQPSVHTSRLDATPTVAPEQDLEGQRRATSRRAPTPRPSAVLVPEHGSGDFVVAPGGSGPTGHGQVVTYSVEVEQGLELDVTDVARRVDQVLADPRSWTAILPRALKRVSANPSIRIRIATPATADALCAPLDTGGRLSCRNGANVVLNAWRWVNGSEAYLGRIGSYRQYMINHEVGHALGQGHAPCPGADDVAPVMLQQTKGLDGCLPNPWPAPAVE